MSDDKCEHCGEKFCMCPDRARNPTPQSERPEGCIECGRTRAKCICDDGTYVPEDASLEFWQTRIEKEAAREWWINLNLQSKSSLATPHDTRLFSGVHVIEFSAYEKVCKERDAYKRAKAENDERFQIEIGMLSKHISTLTLALVETKAECERLDRLVEVLKETALILEPAMNPSESECATTRLEKY